LDELHAAVHQKCRRIHYRFPGVGMGRRHEATDHSDSASLGSDVLGSLAIVDYEGCAFDQVSGRIATNRELRKKDESGTGSFGALRKSDDFC